MPSDLSVVILNWNTSALLQECLRSLFASPLPFTLDVIVVDNASTDDSVEAVRHHWPQVRVIANTHNLGYARGNNLGLAASQGRYALLLNSDTRVSSSALAELITFMDAHPQAGAVGPRLLQPDGSPQPFAFGGDPTPSYLLRRALRLILFRRALHDWNTSQVQVADWVSGACLLVRRQAVEQVGLLDERFFMYFEDNDWCLRLRRHGWKVYYNPQAAITHLGGQSLKRNPAARRAYAASLRAFYAKHYGPLARLWLALSLPVYERLIRR